MARHFKMSPREQAWRAFRDGIETELAAQRVPEIMLSAGRGGYCEFYDHDTERSQRNKAAYWDRHSQARRNHYNRKRKTKPTANER